MRKPRIYVDTSVFGGICDEEFAKSTRRFFDAAIAGSYVILSSPETARELVDAPAEVSGLAGMIPADCREEVMINEEVEALARAYVSAGVVGPAHESDALHVAAATVARADLIVSWNFKHIVNYGRIRKYNGVNALNGYPHIEIRSPQEMDYGSEGENV